MNSYSDIEWKFHVHLLPFNLKSCQTGNIVSSLGLLGHYMPCSAYCCSTKNGLSLSTWEQHRRFCWYSFTGSKSWTKWVVGPPVEWWIALWINLLPPFRKDDEGSRQGAFCLRSFLDLPWPN